MPQNFKPYEVVFSSSFIMISFVKQEIEKGYLFYKLLGQILRESALLSKPFEIDSGKGMIWLGYMMV